MKATLFSRVPYMGPAPGGVWPVPPAAFSPEDAEQSMDAAFDQFELADELGFDWITLAEHHYAPLSLTPNPMVMAGAVSQRVRRAKIALLGANLPSLNPVRVAEEFAMVDVLTGGRLVAGMLRGTATEYVTYGTNPAESRERFEEALQLILRAWTEPQPFGWLGRFYEYRTVAIGRARSSSRIRPSSCPARARSRVSWRRGPVAPGSGVHHGALAREAARYFRSRRRWPGGNPRPTICSTGSRCTWPIPTSRRSRICACRCRRRAGLVHRRNRAVAGRSARGLLWP